MIRGASLKKVPDVSKNQYEYLLMTRNVGRYILRTFLYVKTQTRGNQI